MATQEGIIKLSGSMGGLTFFKRKGRYYVKPTGGGFTSEAIKNKPSMKPVRQNYTDFGLCSTMRKYFRRGLGAMFETLPKSDVYPRLQRLFVKIKFLDKAHTKGEQRLHRGMETPTGKYLLQHFVFNPKCQPFQVLLQGNWEYDTEGQLVRCTGWQLLKEVFPKGATHLAVQVGRMHFDFETGGSETVFSDGVYLTPESVGEPLEFPIGTPDFKGMEFLLLHVHFHELVCEEFYELKGEQSAGLQILGIF